MWGKVLTLRHHRRTRPVFLAWIALSTAGVAGARGDLTFVQKVEGFGRTMETTTRYKDGQTRLDVTPGGTSTLVNAKTGETIALQHERKNFVRVPGTVVQAAVDSIEKQPPPKADAGGQPAVPTLRPTGRKDTISGCAAEEYKAEAGDARLVLWLTHDLPDYARAMEDFSDIYRQGPLAAMNRTGFVDMTRLPGFPVRIVNETGRGAALTSTVTSVSVQPIDDEVFKVPAGYQEITMPAPPTAARPAPTP